MFTLQRTHLRLLHYVRSSVPICSKPFVRPFLSLSALQTSKPNLYVVPTIQILDTRVGLFTNSSIRNATCPANQDFPNKTVPMSDDASYNAFLQQANEPISASHTVSTSPDSKSKVHSTSENRSKFDPTLHDSNAVPKPLRNISVTYVSDTDSEFEPVFFSFSGETLPDAKEFQKVLGRKEGDDVEELSLQDWDSRGDYKEVVEKVRSVAVDSQVKVYRVQASTTRVEYYVLAVGEGKLLGVVTKAVES